MAKKNSLNDPVFKDSRGEIRRYEMNGVKFNALYTKAGVLRSGDYHPVKQYDLILKGEFAITLRKNNQDIVIKKSANDFIVIPPNVPHLFKSLTDTVMIEWWDNEFKASYYKPYRKLIEEQLNKLSKK